MFNLWKKWRQQRHVELRCAVLKAIVANGANAYGVPIADSVNQALGRTKWWNEISIARLYCCLDELEGDGLIFSYTMPGGAERSYRAKRHYYLTRFGKLVLEKESGAVV